MTASPSSNKQSQKNNASGVTQINAFLEQPRLKIVSSHGQLQVYSSPYRGSFSAVLSEAIRSAGLGSRVLIAQFLKGGVSQGYKNKTTLCDKLQWVRPNIYGFINQNSSLHTSENFQVNKNAIQEVWQKCKALLLDNALDKLVLDEIGLAIEYGFIQEQELIMALENRYNSIDVILTGPSIPTKVFSMADQITQLRSSK